MKRSTKKCIIFGLVLSLIFIFALVAQGADKPVLRTLVFQGWARTPSLQKQVLEYEKLTGVKVEIEEVPFSQFHEK